MGLLTIKVQGSFHDHPGDLNEGQTFHAQSGGHAKAVALAIRWLSDVVLPNAIELDHYLHEQGKLPFDRFGLQRVFGVGRNEDHDDPNHTHDPEAA